jgi:hypothetical protein
VGISVRDVLISKVAERNGIVVVLKKLFKALVTLTLLVGCYFGYVHAFAIVVEQLRSIKHTDTLAFAVHDSKSLQESIHYATEACGPGHWATGQDLAYRYYNAERRYWIYAKECERIEEENGVRYNGKRMRLTPFLLLSKSSDGKSTKIITADVAVFDLNEPLSFNVSSSAEPLKIKHARLEPNARVRDDKGTPGDLSDDLNIGPLTTVEYEDSTQQITTPLDTYVVVQDPEMNTTGYGMVMQLRKVEAVNPGGSSGFDGVEKLDLLKNVHVVLRDVGKSGMMPGSASAKKTGSKPAQATIEVAGGTAGGAVPAAGPAEPTPLDLRCDSKMQVFLPRPQVSVLIGPPAPPAPTLVQFDRNVVVLRGKADERPDQLTCDTLKLRLIPGEKAAENATATAPSRSGPGAVGPAGELAQAGPAGSINPTTKKDAAATADGDKKGGPLGGLTLQHIHATGHAVWLYLPAQGVKLVCNELIHVRQLPFKADQTYFRGDRTRPLQMEKVDVVEEEGPDHGKITGVTNIWTADATLFDGGFGMDATNVVAHGPGRLETRADRGKPVERIAIWQDKLIVQNRLGPDNEIVHKIIDLVGNRPCFIDNLQKFSLDSGSWIQVWFKPKPGAKVPAGAADAQASALAARSDGGAASANGQSAGAKGGSTPATGGGLQMENLHAIVDVHMLAPAKTMTARERLDANFVDDVPVEVAAATPVQAAGVAGESDENAMPPPPPVDGATEADPIKTAGQVAASDEEEKPADESPMIGSCDRMWARIALKPKTQATVEAGKAPTALATTKTAGAGGKSSGETDAEIRRVWMWGNVALHQDPKKDKDKKASATEQKGQDASGEALYLDNQGKNKAISYVYQRDPTEKSYLPGPLPPAHVENDDIKIAAAGTIKMNQGTDQAWVFGPGTLTQWAARGFLSDKKAAEAGDLEPAGEPVDGDAATPVRPARGNTVTTHTTSFVAQNNRDATAGTSARPPVAEPKPATRAGRPTAQKVPMTIGFSDNMEFTGRSVDPEGRPAAQAEFYGIVTAQMEDALLHCTKKMIAYTDREVPLAQLGKMSKGQSKGDGEGDDADGEAKSQAELTLIFCYRDAIAINRKVDPNAPILIQQQRIEADELLAYDRRTGDFMVPRKGKVYLYDRADNSSDDSPDAAPGVDAPAPRNPNLTATQRTVTTTSGRPPERRQSAAGTEARNAKSASKRQRSKTKVDKDPSDDLPLTLMQIHFSKGMRGQFGSGGETDKVERRWSEFYGDVQAARAKVATAKTTLDFDRLPGDGFFLTSQTLLVTEEPPPVGSPSSTPSRHHMKAWEKVYTSSKDKILQSDVMTYDSAKDLIFAYGVDGHNVSFAEQHAAGQPLSRNSAKAVQLNPKTGGLNVIDSDTIQMIDKNTGYRPSAAQGIDPYDKKKKPVKKPFKLPTMNVERRGFTGQ